jgi:hypothetical protein
MDGIRVKAPTPLLLLSLFAVLSACGGREDEQACASLKALDPAKAVAAAVRDDRAGDAKFLAVYGQFSVETPGAPQALETSGVRMLPTAFTGDCADVYAHAVKYATRYNEKLWSLKNGGRRAQ